MTHEWKSVNATVSRCAVCSCERVFLMNTLGLSNPYKYFKANTKRASRKEPSCKSPKSKS